MRFCECVVEFAQRIAADQTHDQEDNKARNACCKVGGINATGHLAQGKYGSSEEYPARNLRQIAKAEERGKDRKP